MLIKKICILGGSGFVGRALANRLTPEGYQLRVLTRNRERRKENLILLPTLDLIQADIHDPEQLRKNFTGCDAVINLVGILNERGRHGTGFRHAHVDLARKMIEACRDTHIRRILHMSALNADTRLGLSHYLKTKGEAEDLVHAAADGIRVTSFKPSVIFGREDSFFNRFANLLKLAPVFPLACPEARFAPVYVGDVAEAITRTLTDPDSYSKRYNLCGPQIFTLLELVRYTAKCAGMKRLIIPLPDILSRLQAAVFDFIPGKPFSTDNYLSTKVSSICDRNDLITLGVTPVGVEAVVPQYLAHRFQRARYNLYRSKSRRNQYS
jgi:uncharacterized protein YbjT (DUF2867 family)